MRYAALWVAALFLAALTAGTASAQGTVLILETTVEGGISDLVAEQFREALYRGVSENTQHTVLSESDSRDRLGPAADRLMRCGSNDICLVEVGNASGADAAIVAAVGEAAEIYAFTVDVYELTTGEGLYFTDADCPLCTVDEAMGAFGALGVEAADALEAIGAEPTQVVRGETITLFIRAEPESARIWLNGEPVGTGVAEAAVGPGSYQLTVTAEGYVGVDEVIVVEAGDDDKVVNVRLQPDAAVVAPSGPYVRQGGLLDDVDTTIIGSILTGTGLAAMVTGIVLLAIDGETTCSQGAVTECEDVYETTAGGTVLTVLGASALTAGVALLLWDTFAGTPVPVADDSAQTRVDVGFTDEAGFVRLGGRF